jgi:hypothetical protein
MFTRLLNPVSLLREPVASIGDVCFLQMLPFDTGICIDVSLGLLFVTVTILNA